MGILILRLWICICHGPCINPRLMQLPENFTNEIRKPLMTPDLTCIPTTEAVEPVRRRLQDQFLPNRTRFTPIRFIHLALHNSNTARVSTEAWKWVESESCAPSNKAFIKSTKMHRKEGQTPTREKENGKQNSTVILHVAALSEKLRRLLLKHDTPVCFTPRHALTQKMVHPKLPNTS